MALLFGAGPAGLAITPDLPRAVPQAHLVAVLVDLPGSAAPSAAPDGTVTRAASHLLRQLREGGLLPTGAEASGILADTFTSLAVLAEFPFALVVTDARAKSLGNGSHRLAELQIALIVKTGGRNKTITRHIQALLTARTRGDTARITKGDEFDTTTFTLADTRLPAWAQLKWAALGDFYLVTLGRHAFEASARTIRGELAPLASDPWFAARLGPEAGKDIQIAWTVNLQRIDEALAPVMAGRPAAVVGALGLGGVDRALWSIGRRGRAVVARAAFTAGGENRTISIIRPTDAGTRLAHLIPPEADAYALIDYPPGKVVEHVRDAILASRRPAAREKLLRAWRELERRAGVRMQADLLDHLGDTTIVHTYPRHPLGVPLMYTVLLEIDGAPERVRETLDALGAQLAAWLRGGVSDEAGEAPNDWFAPRLRRSEDGIWYLQAGVNGPGIAVADKWIVLSFSPRAVRQNLARLKGLPRVSQDDGL